MDYDKAALGCWFASMGEAVSARHKLKQINPRAIYDVYSYPDPWDEATDMRKDLLMRTMEIDPEAPEPEIEDDAAIRGDNDMDPLSLLEALNPTPVLHGKDAILFAKTGIGQLMFVRDGIRIPVTQEEAEALASVTPSAIHLYRAGSVEL